MSTKLDPNTPIWKKIFHKVIIEAWPTYKTIIIALVIALMIRTSIIGNYKVPTGSMIPTIEIGDHLFASHISYSLKLPVPFTNINIFTYDKPKRGDIIVFRSPDKENPGIDMVKRVIGLPGDKIEVKSPYVYINDEKLEINKLYTKEKFEIFGNVTTYNEKLIDLNHKIQHFESEFLLRPQTFGPYTVPPDSYFVMGDNRDNSRDSRYWGVVPFNNIKGKVKIIWFSWDKEGEGFFNKIRFNRQFKLLK
ncbi:MAG: signal peptidase I [Pseudomonadota bacterium]